MKEFNQKLHWKILLISIPIAFLVTFFAFKYTEETFYKSYVSHVNNQYNLFEKKIDHFLIDKDALIKSLSSHSAVKNFVMEKTKLNEKVIKDLFFNQVKLQKDIMQLRLVSLEGMELIRVDREEKAVNIIKTSNLQNKSHRDYFKKFIQLKQNEMGISSLDLNIEQGKIEIPFKPTVRVSTPIYIKGELKALIIINYAMNKWLEEFKKSSFLEFYLLDKDGYFILHPEKRLDWSKFKKQKYNAKEIFDIDVDEVLSSDELVKQGVFLAKKIEFFNDEQNIILYSLDTKTGISNYLDYSKILGFSMIVSLLLILLPFSKLLYEYIQKMKRVNSSLKNSENRINKILDNTFDAIIMINRQGIIQNINKAAQEIFLYEREELIGKNIKIIVPEPHHSNHDEYLKKHNTEDMNTKVIGFERELFGIDKEENLIPVNIAITKLIIDNEIFFIGTIRDLRDEKKNKKLFQNVYDNSPLGIALVLKDGSFWQVNESFCDIVGYPHDELLSLTFQDITHKDDLNIDESNVKKLINKQIDSYTLDKRYIHKNGHIVWVSLSVRPFFSDDKKNNLEFFIATIDDITERKNILENLQSTKDRLLEAEEVSQTGHWDWNIRNNDLYWSEVMLKVFGETRQSFGKSYEAFLNIVHEDDREKVDNTVQESFNENKPFNMEYKILVDNKVRYIKAQGRVIYDNGSPIRMYGTCQDISDIKNLMEIEKKQEYLIMQQAKLASMGEMVAAIAHQWRQPLNSIGLAIQDLSSAFKYDEIDEEYLSELKEEVMGQLNYMSNTIDEFRGFFKKSNIIDKFNIIDTISEIETFYKAQLNKFAINLELKYESNKDNYLITSKASELKQIIINCISNSKDSIAKLDTMDSIEKTITVKLEKDDNLLNIYINDFAGGIDEETKNRIFEPYFTTKDMGTGLGLYIAKMIVEKSLKGKISHKNIYFENELKSYKGSSFLIQLPLAI